MPMSWDPSPLKKNYLRGVLGSILATLGIGASPPSTAGVAPTAIRTAAALATAGAALAVPAFAAAPSATAKQVVVDSSVTYQPFLGVGAAIPDSTAKVLMTNLTAAQRAAFLLKMFGPETGLSTIRVCMTDSDFTSTFPNFTTRNDVANDTTMANFSIARDLQYVIPVVLQILAINPNVKVIATPWTPPAWMKSNTSLVGGNWVDNATNGQAFALYFVKWIQAWQAQGVPIHAVTPMNEPNAAQSYPSCVMTSAQIATFVGSYLGPALAGAGLATKIWTGDAAWADEDIGGYGSNPAYVAASKPYVDAICYHGYSPDPSDNPAAIQGLNAAYYAGKGSHLTECSFAQNAAAYTAGDNNYSAGRYALNPWRNGNQSITWWCLALDPNGQPGPTSYKMSCPALIDAGGNVTYRLEYYLLLHLAKYGQRGAVRCDSSTYALAQSGTDVGSQAWVNPDGSVVVFLCNMGTSSQTVSVVDQAAGNQATPVTLAAGDWTTVTWRNVAAAAVPQAPVVTAAPRDSSAIVDLASLPPGNGGSAIQGYNVYLGATKVTPAPVPLPYVLTGLTNGVASAAITVTAVNANGEGAASAAVTTTPTNVQPAHYFNAIGTSGGVYGITTQGGFAEPTDGFVDIAVEVALSAYGGFSSVAHLLGKWGSETDATKEQARLVIGGSGALALQIRDAAGGYYSPSSGSAATVASVVAANQKVWLRGVANMNAVDTKDYQGVTITAGTAQLFYSFDGKTWTALGAVQTAAKTGVYKTGRRAGIWIAPSVAGVGVAGKVFGGIMRDGTGKILAKPDFTKRPTSAATSTNTANDNFSDLSFAPGSAAAAVPNTYAVYGQVA